ncbi:UNVERIFIED_ORG: hypothetical protein J2X79_004332 [Arthrobacter globiformis]|nr:hypothetical protein [Arthrobacter globiformis]
MGYSITTVLNLTFLATLSAGFVFFVWHALLFTAILVLAGLGQLAVLTLQSLFTRRPARPLKPVRGKVIPQARHSSGSRRQR